MLKSQFKAEHPLEKRREGASRILERYPDRIPAIVEKARLEDPDLDQKKFLVPQDSEVAKFILQIRKHMKLNSAEAIFIFVGDKHYQPIGTTMMSEVYEKHKDEDGFLYITYSSESIFG
eukprot:TRINITY_DN1656_c0_g1_i2.p1 TRINITY_DN1656_c0_g1~~TRINITY_DN1656_c0_g1_i2.p1  ORF type:complete len:119 (+),score=35.00 TRINITY_DN1656_c0_g1_i2:115-471(+)